MPPTRERIGNAQGRQKSCSECAKGKRKCDLGNPICGRCRKQRLSCTYPQPAGFDQPFARPTESSLHGIEEPDVSIMNVDSNIIEHTTMQVNFDLTGLPEATSTSVADVDFGADVAFLGSVSNMLYTPSNDQCQLTLGRSDHRGRTPKSFSSSHIAPFAKSRVEWSIQQLKLVPRTMVEQNGTPWQHSMLYHEDMPRSLQDAYAACALYIAMNDTNKDFVFRFIKGHAEVLVNSPMPREDSELLSRAHALMLYQSMLVFGGEVGLYSQAELLVPCMEEVAFALLTLADEQDDATGSIPLYPSAVARASWAAYIFRESLRRTVLAIFQFVTMCNLLRGQLTSCNQHLALGSRLTISAQLWNAKTAFDYAIVWNNQRHFIVKELDFTEVMRNAIPEDIDTLGKMLMISLQGEDDIKGWFYTRGGVL